MHRKIKAAAACLLLCAAARAAWEKTATVSLDYTSLAEHKGWVFFGTTKGVIVSKDAGKTWDVNATVYGGRVWRMLSMGDTLFAATADRGLVFTLDMGKTWQEPATGPGHQDVRWVDLHEKVLYLASQKGGIFQSKDGGKNWQAINTGLPSLQAYAVAGGGGYLFAGTAGTTGHGVYRSADNGAHWEAAEKGFNGHGCAYLVCDGKNLFAGPFDHLGVIASRDWGASWDTSIATQGRSQPPFVHSLEVYGPNALTASPNNGGVNFSKDGGLTWLYLNQNVTPKVERPHYVGVAAGYVFAGSATYGIWRLPVSETPLAPVTTALRPSLAPARASLLARRGGGLELSLSEAGRFSLSLFDVSGSLLQRVEGRREAGAGALALRPLERGAVFNRLRAPRAEESGLLPIP
jgi:photosystem II stability/assembly factor-like uncharacterized protein